MTATVPRWATDEDHPLIEEYACFCHALGVTDRALRDRLRLARTFLEQHPDLKAWLAKPTPTRLADLKEIKAWSLVSWAGLTGRVRIDLDLLAAKDLGGMSATIRQLWPIEFDQLWETARRLRWSYNWSRGVIDQFVPAVVAWSSKPISQLSTEQIEAFEVALGQVTTASTTTRRQWHGRLFGLHQLLFESGQIPEPPKRGSRGATMEERLAVVPNTEIKKAMVRYVKARAAVLSSSSLNGLVDDLIPFGLFLGEHHPKLNWLAQLERHHTEEFLSWNRTRTWRGRVARDQQVSPSVVHSTVLTVRNFLDDVILWGWEDRPTRRLVFASDVPRLPRPLPRALAPDTDAALMAAVVDLDDSFARAALLVLRKAGLRLGECLDLELGCVVDYGPTGTWLRVPLGKLATERSVPLDADTVVAIDAWVGHRGTQRPHRHPRTGAPTDFLFTEHGRRLKPWRIRAGLRNAATAAGLSGPGGNPLRITPHVLRHTYATELANAGMSLQALMAVLGHVTPEMTLRYAALGSPTVRAAYDEAMGKVRKLIPVASAGRPAAPSKVEWIASEFLKTRLTGGYCSRHLAAEACPYANVCETCDNFVPTREVVPALRSQLDDVRALKDDAERREWTSEVARHQRVIEALDGHLKRLKIDTSQETLS
jgi:integrase